MGDCIIAMKSNSAARTAERALRSVGISSTIVGIDPSITRRGCGFGLRMSCSDINTAVRTLDRKRITYGDIIGSY